jgi:hypothetical protein
MDDTDDDEAHRPLDSAAPRHARNAAAALKPKGACWYCNQPLDNVRRFCSKACAEDFRTEEEVFNPRPE